MVEAAQILFARTLHVEFLWHSIQKNSSQKTKITISRNFYLMSYARPSVLGFKACPFTNGVIVLTKKETIIV